MCCTAYNVCKVIPCIIYLSVLEMCEFELNIYYIAGRMRERVANARSIRYIDEAYVCRGYLIVWDE